METAIMQQDQLFSKVHSIQQAAGNHSEEEDLSTIPCLVSVKKSHSTPQNSFADKLNQFSDRQQQQKESDLHEIKEQEKTEISTEEQPINRNKQNSAQQQNKKKEKDVEMRKISTAASEELKVDYPQQLTKSNSSSQCNLLDYKHNLIDSNDQKSDATAKLENLTNIQRQEESKKLQTLYQESSEKNKFFEEKLRKNIKEFALDKYSHFVLILVLDIGSSGHKRIIIENTLKEKELFSHEQFGHKILNKCIEVSQKEFIDLYNEFIKYILDNESKTYQTLQNDKFGNYVIQKCLEIFDEDHLSQLLILLNATLLIKPEQKLPNLSKENQQKENDLCSDQYGCLIIQKLIEIYKTKPDSKIKKQVGQMIEKVINDSYRLAQRQFSNYVVQQILEKGAPEHKNMLYQNVISKHFINLAMDKYGSNVAEKAIKFAEKEQIKLIWGLICSNNFSSLLNMVNDQYANYVVQRIFDFSAYKEQKQIHQQLSQWNKKNLLKENGKHPFKYIDEIFRQSEFHNQTHGNFRNNQSKINSQDNFSSINQPNYQSRQNQHISHNSQNPSQNFNNQNTYMEYNQNMKQSNYNQVNRNQQYQKNQNQNANANFQGGNNKNRQINNSKMYSNNQNFIQNHQNQNNFNQDSPSSNKQNQKFDQNKMNKSSNKKQQQTHYNSQPFQNVSNSNMSFKKTQNVEQKQIQGQYNNQDNNGKNNIDNSNNHNGNTNYNNHNNQSYGKRNSQGNQNYQQNNANRSYRRHPYNRGNFNYNHPMYYPGYPQQYFIQQPYYGYPPYIYLNQNGEFPDPQMINYFDPNNMMNPPYFDFLQGAHIKVLQNQNSNNNDAKKQEQQSEVTTQPNSLNSPQTNIEVKQDDNQNKQTVQQENKEASQ